MIFIATQNSYYVQYSTTTAKAMDYKKRRDDGWGEKVSGRSKERTKKTYRYIDESPRTTIEDGTSPAACLLAISQYTP